MTAVLLALGAALRGFMLGAKSLWFDEASTLLLAAAPLSRLPAMIVRDEGNPPLFAALMHFWVPLFSDPRLGLRAFSALCGVASLFAFRALARRVLPEKDRLPALFFAAFSSYWVHLAQDGRVYAFLLLLALLEASLVWDLAESPAPRRWAAYAALSAAGLYAHYYFAVVLAGHAVWLLARGRAARRNLKDWAIAHAAIAAAFLPWLPFFRAQLRLHVGDPVLGEALTPRHLLDTLGTMFYDPTFLGLALPSWLPVAVGAGAVALLAVAGARARRASGVRRRELAYALFGLGAPLALILLVELALRRPVTQARYFAPFSPFLYLAAASALEGSRLRARAARVLAMLTVAAGLLGYFVSARYVDPHLGALAENLRTRTESRLPIVYVGSYYYLPMRVYYLPERAQYLAAEGNLGYDYAGIPPYDGLLGPERLRRLGPCLVVDEARRLSPQLAFAADGPALAARLFPRP
jgi:mannosyltransferase